MLLLNLDFYPERVIKTASSIGYNSNVYFTNDNSSLYELYSFGLHLHNTTLRTKEISNWTDCEGYLPSYKLNERGNMMQTQLRGVTVARKFD